MSAHSSVWRATADLPSFPTLSNDLDVDVAVVGGGITGITTALLLQRSGARVALVEAREIGAGTTGGTTGKVTSQHGLCYHRLIERHGVDRARRYAEANQAAVELVSTLADETAADCQLERAPAYVYTRRPGQRSRLDAENRAARRLGLPSSLTHETDLPVDVELAVRFDDQLHLHPGRYLAALARTVVAGGGRIVEHTRATALEDSPNGIVVRTSSGSVRAEQVVLATLLPFADRGGYFARTRPARSYGIAARLRSGGVTGMHISVDEPIRSTRPWIDGGRRDLIVVGEGHETGSGDARPGRWGELERWTREHFDVESFEHRWSAQDYRTADDLPYVGRSPRSQRTFVATGFAKWGLSNGTAAAVVITDLINGRANPWLPAFDATRVGGPRAVGRMVEDNIHVGWHLVGDRLRRLSAGGASQLAPGEGALVRSGLRTVAAWRDAEGRLHAVSPTCTHLGCSIRWNAAERSWDCPCHGSRFDVDGAVLDGPAVDPLRPIGLEDDR